MVLARLREETALVHRAVEEEVDLLSPTLTVGRYIRILQAFHSFFRRWEAQLDQECPERLAGLWGGRKRSQKLMADLEWLGSHSFRELQDELGAPQLGDEGRWLGALYVLEGSTLGGQVISRHLEGHFGWKEGRGYSFFQGHGTKTVEMWRGVCAELEKSGARYNQIVEGAHLTFDCLRSFILQFQ